MSDPNKEYRCKLHLGNDKWCYVDGYLQGVADSMVYNLGKDWDFCITVTGDRMVRTGKSVLAMNFGAYCAKRISQVYKIDYKFTNDNIFFDSQTMIDAAQKMPKYSVVQYDEAREGLAAIKAMSKLQQDLMDFFNECGQLNHIFILVLPDFFTLKEEMAIARSECLINVVRTDETKMINMYGDGKRPVTHFKRGKFNFYNRYTKQNMFDFARSSKRRNYGIVNPTCYGYFKNIYPIDEDEYRKNKADALARFKERHEKASLPSCKADIIRNKIIAKLRGDGMTFKKIGEELKAKYGYDVGERNINQIYNKQINTTETVLA